MPPQYQNCNNINPRQRERHIPDSDMQGQIDPADRTTFATNCYADGEASLAVKNELANGAVVTSLVGYTVGFNSLDNNKMPTEGLRGELAQDFAGVGGSVNFIRTTGSLTSYHEVSSGCCGYGASAGRPHHRLGR